jgi:hypothetical protein
MIHAIELIVILAILAALIMTLRSRRNVPRNQP